MKNIIQLSGGKDSLALLLESIRREYKVDEVVYFDVGDWEYQSIRKNIDKAEQLCIDKGIKFSRVYPTAPFHYLAWERVYSRKDGTPKIGYEWCGWHGCRWGTSMKTAALNKHCKDNLQVIGIAFDEQYRIEKESAQKVNKAYWLSDWRLTESDCLQICYDNGFDWLEYEPLTGQNVELYSFLDRVSCWCCGNKNLKELYGMYVNLPSYWNRLRDYQLKTEKPFKQSGNIFELEERFKKGCITKNDLKKSNR